MTTIEEMTRHYAFCRGRTLGTLDAIEKLPKPQTALAWRPGPGRAHIGWQLMHIAATDDGYLHKRILNAPPADAGLVERFGGGSTPADDNVPSLAQIKTALAEHRGRVLDYLKSINDAQLDTNPAGPDRTLRDWLLILGWHEAHHQGQAHLTLNLYQAIHGQS